MSSSAESRRRRTSWNAERPRKSKKGSAGSLTGRRIGWTLFVTAVVALTGWGLWSLFRSPGRTAFAAIVLEVENPYSAPPLPFPAEARADWAKMVGEGHSVLSSAKDLTLPATREQDVLIVYVLGHGFSCNGQAWLAEPSLNRISDESDRVKVVDLLDVVSKQPARIKLVIFDSARFATAPTQGMLVNEFPRLLEQETAATNDRKLWVLNSAELLEIGHVSFADQRSLFGKAVSDALSAETPEKGRRELSLRDVYETVRARCKSFQTPFLIRGGKGRIADAEVGDLGNVTLLVRAPFKAKPAKASDDEAPPEVEDKADKKEEPKSAARALRSAGRRPVIAAMFGAGLDDPPADGKPSAPAAAQPAPAAPAADQPEVKASPVEPREPPQKPGEPEGEKPAPKPEPAPAAAAPAGAVQKKKPPSVVTEAWELRDALRSRGASVGPIDFSPDLWRRWNRIVLHAEQRDYLGRPDYARENLPAETAPLTALEAAIKAEQPVGTAVGTATSGGGKINRAWGEYLSSYKSEPHRTGEQSAVDASRRLADLLAVASDLVAWHDSACLFHPQDPEVAILGNSVGTFLGKLAKVVSTLRNLPVEGATDDQVGQIVALMNEVEVERGTIDRFLEKQVRRQAGPQGDPRHIEALLSTPLVAADDRRTLIENLKSARPEPRADSGDARDKRWELVQKRAELHRQLAMLSVQGNSLGKFAFPLDATNDDNRMKECNRWGEALAEFYRSLRRVPSAAKGRDAAPADPGVELETFVAANLVDPRDVDVQSEQQRFTAFRVRLRESEPELKIVYPTDQPLRVPDDGKAELALAIHALGPSRFRPESASISVSRAAALDLAPVPPARWSTAGGSTARQVIVPFQTNPGDSAWIAEVAFTVAKARSGPALVDGKLTIGAETVGGGAPLRAAPVEVSFRSGPPNRVEVFNRNADAKPGDMKLRPLPNRRTTFSLGLRNLYDAEKNVSVRIYAGVPPAIDDDLPPGKLWVGRSPKTLAPRLKNFQDLLHRELAKEPQSLDKALKRRKSLKLVAEAKEHLAAGAEDVELRLKKPQPPKPEGAPATAPAAAPAAAPDPDVITEGLLCVIEEQVKPGEAPVPPWLHWIEFEPRHPRDYVEARISYVLSRKGEGRIEIDLERINPKIRLEAGWKSALKENTIDISCDNWRDISEKSDSIAALKPPAASGKLLFRDVAPGDQEYVAELTVDDYPRAFRMYAKSTPNAGPDGIPFREDDQPLHGIRSVTCVYERDLELPTKSYYWREADNPRPRTGKPPANELFEPLPPGQPAVFRPTREELRVRIAVDRPPADREEDEAPFEARVLVQDERGTRPPERRFTERDAAIALADITEEGQLVVGCTVQDHEVKVPAIEFRNQWIAISVESPAPARENPKPRSTTPPPDRVDVALFEAAPTIRLSYDVKGRANRPRDIEIGQVLVPRLDVIPEKDRRRLQRVRYWLHTSRTPQKPPDEAEPTAPDNSVPVELPTKAWKPGIPCYLCAQAEDYAGNKTPIRSEEVSLVLPKVTMPETPAKKPSLKVAVPNWRTNEKPKAGDAAKPTTVMLLKAGAKGPPVLTANADPTTGSATFAEVPDGVYDVMAEVKETGVDVPSRRSRIVVKGGQITTSDGKALTGELTLRFP